jgi:hypothetical protein
VDADIIADDSAGWLGGVVAEDVVKSCRSVPHIVSSFHEPVARLELATFRLQGGRTTCSASPARCPRPDSNGHCTAPQTVASCQLGYEGILLYVSSSMSSRATTVLSRCDR